MMKSRLFWFFVAHTQSCLGDYAAYVALVLLANERFHNPLVISLLILAEFLPGILCGSLIGNFVDAVSKRKAAVVADLLRVVAFVGLAIFDSLLAMLAMALLAGLGTALYYTAVQSGLPNMAEGKCLNQVLSWQSTITSGASIAGPLVAGVLLIIWAPAIVLLANAVTFIISAVILSRLPLDTKTPETPSNESHLSLRASLYKAARLPARFQTLLIASGFVALFAGTLGVTEIYFALDTLHIGQAGVGILIACYGGGMVLGNLASLRPSITKRPEKGYLLGMLLLAIGLIVSSQLTQPILAIAAFSLAGFGNGLITVSARFLITAVVKPTQQGLAYGVRHAVESSGLVVALLSAALLVSLVGPPGVLLLAGLGVGLTLVATWLRFTKLVKPRAT